MHNLAIALLLALTSADAVEGNLKPFDFMGFVAGQVVTQAQLKGCRNIGKGICIKRMVRVSDAWADYMLTLHEGKISRLYLDAHPNSYLVLRAAFTAKYGEPCEIVDTVWKNAAGAELSNPTSYWCFTSGKLRLARYGAQIDKMLILYEDQNRPAQAAPTLNF